MGVFSAAMKQRAIALSRLVLAAFEEPELKALHDRRNAARVLTALRGVPLGVPLPSLAGCGGEILRDLPNLTALRGSATGQGGAPAGLSMITRSDGFTRMVTF